MMDANCRVGSHTSVAVGDCQPDEQDESGAMFNRLLVDLDVWLPSTFAHCMYGDGGTLRQKRSGTLDRSDFVGIPMQWSRSRCSVWTEPHISAGHMHIDHFATVVQVDVLLQHPVREVSRAQRIDVRAVADPDNSDVVAGIIRDTPRPDWSADVSEHAATIIDHLYCKLSEAFPVRRRRMRASYISEASEALHRVVSSLRHSVRSRKLALQQCLVRCAFLAWRSGRPFLSLFQGAWLWQLETRFGLSCMLLRRYGLLLRKGCREDRNRMYADLAAEISQSSAASMHSVVKRVLRPKKFRKPGNDPLPTLFRADGSQCLTTDDITKTWREHFRVLEGGLQTTPDELLQECRSRHAAFEGSDRIDAGDIPSWTDLEAALRHTSGRKAAGPDLIPPILCKLFSPQLTEVLWPLLLKTICYSAEAAGLKGGVLHHICKPQPKAPHTCDAHRGILVQSAVTKAFHRSLRGLVVKHWQGKALPIQLGGRAGCSATFGGLCSRAVLAFARRQGLSASLIFVDLSSAYYAVIRETLMGAGLSSRPIHETAEALGLSCEDLRELKHLVEAEAILDQQQAPLLLQELTRELHQHTWFILSRDSQMISTFRGTRPGSTLADVLFNLLFGQALKRRRSKALQAAIPVVPWNGDRSPFPSEAAGEVKPQAISDILYADDLCTPVVCKDAQHLRGTVSAVAADTFDILTPHALRVNLGPTKTAAIMAHAGRGSREARREVFGALKGRTPIWTESKGLLWLDLVARYRHLGSMITHDGSLLAEVRHRVSLARVAFRDGRRRLFACKDIQISRRAVLFRSHVLSTLLVGVGGWPLLSAGAWTVFSGGVIGLYRQLLGLRADGKWDYTTPQILAMTGLPSPRSLLSAERLRFVSQLARNAPDELWALIGWFDGFQAALIDAGTWLLDAVSGTCELGPIRDDWPKWRQIMCEQPGRWKGLIKRAECWHGLRDQLHADVDGAARSAWEADASRTRSDLAGLVHGCLVCGLAFASRQQWGAHAQRVHGYRNAATRLALGRCCSACGSVYATQARLRCHLLASVQCRQALENGAVVARATVSDADPAAGHLQMPVIRGWGRADLPAATQELCLPLQQALVAEAPSSDQAIYDLVVSHIAPLPVLRRTLSLWHEGLLCPTTRDAAADVLLVLTPEHLCTHLAGKDGPCIAESGGFNPRLIRPVLRFPAPSASVFFFGRIRRSWLDKWNCAGCAQVPLDLHSTATGALRCFGVYVEFPKPPEGYCSLLSPAPCQIRCLRRFREWTALFLRVFCRLYRTAMSGRPALLKVAGSRSSFEPIASWIAAATEAEDPQCSFPSCFTLEFNLH